MGQASTAISFCASAGRVFAAWGVAALLLGARASAQEPLGEAEVAEAPVPELIDDETSREIAELAQRALRLEQHAGLGPEVSGPLSATKRALEAMRQAWARRDEASTARAEALARASLALAERRASLAVEQGLMRAAVARREAARARLASAQAARAAESDRLRALTPAPEAAPTAAAAGSTP